MYYIHGWAVVFSSSVFGSYTLMDLNCNLSLFFFFGYFRCMLGLVVHKIPLHWGWGVNRVDIFEF